MAKQTVIVSVLADTKKFTRAFKNLSKEVGLTSLGNGFKNLGSRVGGFVKGAVKGVAGLGAVVAGLALHGGIKRALAIEDAEAALRGLGHGTKSIEKIMDSALASVKGTSFGLGDAATIASTAVAAGIKPGQELTRTLKLTANTAALARTGLSDMGSILNKVWTSGRAQTQELNQIADRGIPIWTSLAEHYGVNAAELRKMVSAGKVDATTFATVLESTVGTAADEMGKTTRGMAQNVMAALGRAGEAFVSKFLPMVRDAMGGAMTILDKVAPVVADLGAQFGHWVANVAVPAVKALGKWLTGSLWPALQKVWKIITGAFSDAVAAVSGALKTAGASAKDTGKSIGDTLLRAVRVAGNVIAGLVRTIGNIVAWVIEWRDVLAPIAVVIATVVASIVTFTKVMAIAKAVQLAFNVVMAANPIGLVVTAVAALAAGLTYFFTQTETGKAAWAGFTSFLGQAWEWVKNAAGVLWEFLKTVFSWTPVGIITRNWNKITKFFTGVKDKVIGVFRAAWDFIKSAWKYTPLGLITGNWNKIMDFLRGIPGKVQGVFSSAVSWLKNAGTSIITGMKNGLTAGWSTATKWIGEIKDKVLGFFTGGARWLWDAGRDIVQGLLNGVGSLASSVGQFFLDKLPGWIQGPFKRALGIKSPSKVFAGYGKNIVQGLVKGINGDAKSARKAAGDLAKLARDAFTRGDKKHGERLEWLSGQADALDKMRRSLAKQNAVLDQARDKLKALRQERKAMVSQIASSVMGTINLSSIVAKSEDGKNIAGGTKFADVSQYVKTLKTKFKTFATRLKSLGSAGFPAGLIQMVAGLGPDDGIEVAQALLSGSAAEIKELKADWSALESWSKKAGVAVAGATYDTAIAAQEGLVKGLTADTKKAEKAAKSLAKNLAKWIRKELGIKSPSRVFRDIGNDTLKGLVVGIEKSIPGVRRAMGKVSDAVTSAPMTAKYTPATLDARASRDKPGNTYNITVHGVLDGADAGRKITAALRDYERMNGVTR